MEWKDICTLNGVDDLHFTIQTLFFCRTFQDGDFNEWK